MIDYLHSAVAKAKYINNMVVTVSCPGEADIIHRSKKNRVLIGRKDSCDIVIPKEEISRKHCLIEVQGDDLYITDLNGVNGVFINGERITTGVPVRYQSIFSLVLGFNCVIKISLEEEEDSGQEKIFKAQTPPGNLPRKRLVTKTSPVPLTLKEKSRSGFLTLIIGILILIMALYFHQNRENVNMFRPGPSSYEKSFH